MCTRTAQVKLCVYLKQSYQSLKSCCCTIISVSRRLSFMVRVTIPCQIRRTAAPFPFATGSSNFTAVAIQRWIRRLAAVPPCAVAAMTVVAPAVPVRVRGCGPAVRGAIEESARIAFALRRPAVTRVRMPSAAAVAGTGVTRFGGLVTLPRLDHAPFLVFHHQLFPFVFQQSPSSR